MGKTSQYGVMLDAGSSGTRIYVYKWKSPSVPNSAKSKGNGKTLPHIKLEESRKIHPGVSTFATNVAAVGREHLASLIEVALAVVPKDRVSETPVFLMATAGVRFLPKPQQEELLAGVCDYLQRNTGFRLPDCQLHVQVISGETEGLYGWLAANYLLGGFDEPAKYDHGKGHHTYGFLDMGGASAQIAFVPNATEAERHADDLKSVRMRYLDGSPLEYKLFTATWLGFGANKARERYIKELLSTYDDKTDEIPDPCLPKGLHTDSTGKPLTDNFEQRRYLVGTGAFDECVRRAHPLLGKEKPCIDQPCLLDGQHVPGIDFDVNHFVGVSEYWHATHGVFSAKKQAYNLATYRKDVNAFCSKRWTEIVKGFEGKNRAEDKAMEAQQACFKAAWVINMLYEGIGIPLDVAGNGPLTSPNITKGVAEKAKSHGFDDRFRPVDDIDGIELSWTLGKMVLYAAGQIPPSGSNVPVGFGSNVGAGIAKDFQYAGSVALPPSLVDEADEESDFDDPLKTSRSFTAVFVFLIALLVAAYILRKPEPRRKVLSLCRRHKPGSRRASGVLFQGWKLFSTSPAKYERIENDPDLADLELGEFGADDNDSSHAGEGPSSARLSMANAPRANTEGAKPLSAVDRAGLALRTESFEKLQPTMLHAGRRSRAGSPTRKHPGAAAV